MQNKQTKKGNNKMKVFIAGMDGYLGWALCQYLLSKGYEVGGCDNYLRRKMVDEIGSISATPIASMQSRLAALRGRGEDVYYKTGDLQSFSFIKECLVEFQPDAVVNFGQIPSAPYSMIDGEHASFTQQNNIVGNLNLVYAMKEACPMAHLVKLGSMGEYGTPKTDIPEGFYEVEFRGVKDTVPFPRAAGSWYHWSKVHDSNNITFACKLWGLRCTDIMQGVVFGLDHPGMLEQNNLLTRLDFDHAFGTAINRFVVQAVLEDDITPFGLGKQKRGFLPIRDSLRCIELIIENAPDNGEYRVFNQWENIYSVNELAEKVLSAANAKGLEPRINNIVNPRVENEDHRYNVDRNHLINIGYEPTSDIDNEINLLMDRALANKKRLEPFVSLLSPPDYWKR